MDHAVEVRDLAVVVGDQGEVQLGALGLLDVGGPAGVAVRRVDGQADHLHPAPVELRLQLGDGPKFGRADRRVVLGMGEQHDPGVARPVIEVQRTFGGVLGEVGGRVAELQSHA